MRAGGDRERKGWGRGDVTVCGHRSEKELGDESEQW